MNTIIRICLFCKEIYGCINAHTQKICSNCVQKNHCILHSFDLNEAKDCSFCPIKNECTKTLDKAEKWTDCALCEDHKTCAYIQQARIGSQEISHGYCSYNHLSSHYPNLF